MIAVGVCSLATKGTMFKEHATIACCYVQARLAAEFGISFAIVFVTSFALKENDSENGADTKVFPQLYLAYLAIPLCTIALEFASRKYSISLAIFPLMCLIFRFVKVCQARRPCVLQTSHARN